MRFRCRACATIVATRQHRAHQVWLSASTLHQRTRRCPVAACVGSCSVGRQPVARTHSYIGTGVEQQLVEIHESPRWLQPPAAAAGDAVCSAASLHLRIKATSNTQESSDKHKRC
jgi:hypothetical protein